MCTGLEIAAVAAMVGGAGLQAKSAIDSSNAQRRTATDFAQEQTALLRRQSEVNKAAQAKIAEEQAKQQDIRNKVQLATDSAINSNSSTNQNQQIEDLTGSRIQGYKTISDLMPVAIDFGGSKNAPSVVSEAIKGSVDRATTKGDQQAAALAAIQAMGDVSVRNKIGTARTADELGTFSRLNNISNVVAGAEGNYMNTIANLTSAGIENAANSANQRLGIKKAKAQNAKAIGDLLFMAGSMGAPGMGTAAGTPMAGGAQGPTQGSGVKGFVTR